MNEQVYIFSRAIRSGKTTELNRWLAGHKNVAGILTPDEQEMRKLLDIATGRKYDLQVTEAFDGRTVHIGRFRFDAAVIQTAQELLRKACKQGPDWLVVDEAGKLEIEQDAGLEPVIKELVHYYQSGKAQGRLLLVIRDSLLEKAIIKYRLQGATIFTDQLPE